MYGGVQVVASQFSQQLQEQFVESEHQLNVLIESGNFFLKGLKNLLERKARRHSENLVDESPSQDPEYQVSSNQFLSTALKIYKLRSQRNTIFSGYEIFSEPSWDILLDLFIAGETGKSIQVTSACIGSHAPPTTALRFLGELESYGLLVRYNDPLDRRRRFVRLTPKANELMKNFLRCCT